MKLFPEPGEFVIYGILDPSTGEQSLDPWTEEVLKKKKSVSVSTEWVVHWIRCEFTDTDAEVGFFITLL